MRRIALKSVLVPITELPESRTQLPELIQVVLPGKWKTHPAGPFLVDEQTQIEMVKNFNAVGADVVIDLEHASLIEGDPAPAAGWIKQLHNRNGAGVWADVEWTPLGRNMLSNKEKRYVSPVIIFGAKDPETGDSIGAKLDSVALTNRPYLENLPAVVNSKQESPQNNGETAMKEFLEKLAKQLGIKDEPSEDTVLAAMSKQSELIGNLQTRVKEILATIGLGEEAKPEEVTAKVTAMSKAKPEQDVQLQVAMNRIEALESEKKGRDRADFLKTGEADGKIVPANRAGWEKLWDANAVVAAETLAVAPQVVPLGKITPATDPQVTVVTETQQKVNDLIGLTKEDVEKFGQK